MDIVRVLTLALENANKASSIKPESEVYASALRWELYASLQNVLDGLAMIIADLGLRKPGTYSELGSVLRERGILTNEEERHVARALLKSNLTKASASLMTSPFEPIKGVTY